MVWSIIGFIFGIIIGYLVTSITGVFKLTAYLLKNVGNTVYLRGSKYKVRSK